MIQKNNHELGVPFLDLIGVQLVKMSDGESELHLSIEHKHTNSWEVAHGGVLLSLVDAGMAIAARSADPDDRSVVTIELKHTFMQAAVGGVKVRGRVIHKSTTMAFCEATIYDLDEKICGHATGSFKYFKKLPMRQRGADVV
jgi:uncharacterized protein (TIGR00369 family)